MAFEAEAVALLKGVLLKEVAAAGAAPGGVGPVDGCAVVELEEFKTDAKGLPAN